MASPQLMNRLAFGVAGGAALGASGILFKDLADISQWVIKTDRDDVYWTFQNRHPIAALAAASSVVNTAVWYKTRCFPTPVWAGVNGMTAILLFSGYINPEIMMRPRNHNAVYIPNNKILELLKREETVIVTQVGDDSEPRAFPDSQVLRPHVARVGTDKDGIPVTMTYCGLTNLGMAYKTPPHEDGKPMELVPLTQLENNLVLMDKSTGHVGQQINGIDETALLEKLGATSHHETKRKPSQEQLDKLNLLPTEEAEQVPTWRMTLGSFVRTYPNGEVFVNDYKMFKGIDKPIKTIYDYIIDIIFETSVKFQATNPKLVFPTIEKIDPRLPSKEQVWGFNVGDDYVALTEKFVRDGKNSLRNLKVGGVPIVASWDPEALSIGIWYRPSDKPIRTPVDVHGHVQGLKERLNRVPTVKNGVFWSVYANFFPQTRVNPES